MDIETLRRYCLSLPHATEGIQWGNDLLFRIAGKMFAVVALERTPASIAFKCTPEEFAELIEREGIIPAPYMARNNWVMLESLDVLAARRTEAADQGFIRDGGGEAAEEGAGTARADFKSPLAPSVSRFL
jgi:predicted DNA-binding protein (MmcQ/YjbR family)